jgi:SpoVK/Ycf46/Vps4 family AAA+-type ATPase
MTQTTTQTIDDVSALLRARNTLLWVVTREEARAERGLVEACGKAQYKPLFWDCASGVTVFGGNDIDKDCLDPSAALARIRDKTERAVYVLRDLHKWLADPTVLRGLRNLARNLANSPREEARTIIVLSSESTIPNELSGHAIVIDWPLPDRAELGDLLESVLSALPDNIRANAAPNGTRDAAIDAAIGLTAEEAQTCYAKSLVQTKVIDPKAVANEKRRVIAREKVLEWCEPLPGGLDAVGGLDNLKIWLKTRKAAFGQKAREYGLPAPKGALLVGVPGCGKSLTAKAIATAWGMPLLRLDLGALKSKWVGESEGNIRKALKVAEAVSPCVVWLDEIEKALGGVTQGAADGGVSSDALGSILSWMQERQGRVFVVATANDVRALPPELLRKGRFDEIFFVDLPTQTEREAIISSALKSLGRSETIDTAKIAQASVDFTGAELSALVPTALYAAFGDNAREITTSDLLHAVSETVPLAKTASEKIQAVRDWAKGRARNASKSDDNVISVKTARTLNLS